MTDLDAPAGGAFVHRSGQRQSVRSIGDYLHMSVHQGFLMDRARMRDEDLSECRWLGYGLTKGLTSAKRQMSVLGLPESFKSGWHGELMQGLSGVDSNPLCYAPDHKLGFDDFVRWVYFTDPALTQQRHDFFGIDFSIAERETAGVAHTMMRVKDVVALAGQHGIPLRTEVVLLNPRMCEPAFLTQWRTELNLVTVDDWIRNSHIHLGPDGACCIRCGLLTRGPNLRFCRWCGHKHS